MVILACLQSHDGSRWLQIKPEGTSDVFQSKEFINIYESSDNDLQKLLLDEENLNSGKWIIFEEFLRQTQSIKVLNVNPRYLWNSLTINSPDELSLINCKTGIVKIKIWKSGEYTFTLEQHKNSRNSHCNNLDLTIVSVKDLQQSSTNLHWNTKGSYLKLSLTTRLLEGEYLALAKCTRHHSLDLSQINFSCYGEASASLAFLKTESNEDIEHYFDIIYLNLWTNLVEQKIEQFECIDETKKIEAISNKFSKKTLTV
jgi:hypothetical protein